MQMRHAYQQGYFDQEHTLATTPEEHSEINLFKGTMQHSLTGEPGWR